MAKSPEEMLQSMLANLKEKTGKDLAGWLEVTRAAGLEKHGQIVKLLKSEHGVTHGFANLIAHKTLEAKQGGGEADPVAAQYSGPKEHLRPIYDAVIRGVQEFGDSVVIAPKKTYVSLRRNKQFGLVQPSTSSRVDVGINLKETAPVGRLEASGSFNSMVSHRVRLEDPSQVNAELLDWLKAAYDAS